MSGMKTVSAAVWGSFSAGVFTSGVGQNPDGSFSNYTHDGFTVSYPGDVLQPGDIAQVHDDITGTTSSYQYVGQLDIGAALFVDNSSDHAPNDYVAVGTVHTFGMQAYPSSVLMGNYVVSSVAWTACYVVGTRIAVPGGDAAIEELMVGDRVLTADGLIRRIRWIAHRRYSAKFVRANPHLLPIRIKAHAISDHIPARDLLVSPAHAMAIDGFLVPAEALVNGVSILTESGFGDLHYLHLELDSHDLLLAEGAPSESYIDYGAADHFDNGASRPEALRKMKASCMARLNNGAVVDAIRVRLRDRAGVGQTFGPMRGRIDQTEGGRIRGWAQNLAVPEASVCLDVIIDKSHIVRALANRYRGDLKAAGLGSGRHAFDVALPAVADATRLEVRRSSDHMLLDAVELGR